MMILLIGVIVTATAIIYLRRKLRQVDGLERPFDGEFLGS